MWLFVLLLPSSSNELQRQLFVSFPFDQWPRSSTLLFWYIMRTCVRAPDDIIFDETVVGLTRTHILRMRGTFLYGSSYFRASLQGSFFVLYILSFCPVFWKSFNKRSKGNLCTIGVSFFLPLNIPWCMLFLTREVNWIPEDLFATPRKWAVPGVYLGVFEDYHPLMFVGRLLGEHPMPYQWFY